MIARVPTQAFAIVGLAALLAAAHWSVEAPIRLSAVAPVPDRGATVPGGGRSGAGDPNATDPGAVDPGAVDPAAPGAEAGLARLIELDEAMSLFGLATFVDAREAEYYEAGHIMGAVLVPSSDRSRADALVAWGLDSPMVIYCDGGECDASHLVALYMSDLGFTDLMIYHGGYPEWVGAGGQTETGEDPELGPAR